MVNTGAFADVEVHLPCFSPVMESVDISYEGLVVTWVMDVVIKDAVVGKQLHGRAYSISDVIDVEQEEHWAQNCALWDTRENLSCVWGSTVNNNLLLTGVKECTDPGLSLPSDAVVMNLV